MSLLPTLLLALALGPQEPAGDSDVALDARRLAWSWHQEAPSAAQLVASWQESGQADPLLAAAARSLRGEERIAECRFILVIFLAYFFNLRIFLTLVLRNFSL